jgi:hypothetical protein
MEISLKLSRRPLSGLEPSGLVSPLVLLPLVRFRGTGGSEIELDWDGDGDGGGGCDVEEEVDGTLDVDDNDEMEEREDETGRTERDEIEELFEDKDINGRRVTCGGSDNEAVVVGANAPTAFQRVVVAAVVLLEEAQPRARRNCAAWSSAALGVQNSCSTPTHPSVCRISTSRSAKIARIKEHYVQMGGRAEVRVERRQPQRLAPRE